MSTPPTQESDPESGDSAPSMYDDLDEANEPRPPANDTFTLLVGDQDEVVIAPPARKSRTTTRTAALVRSATGELGDDSTPSIFIPHLNQVGSITASVSTDLATGRSRLSVVVSTSEAPRPNPGSPHAPSPSRDRSTDDTISESPSAASNTGSADEKPPRSCSPSTPAVACPDASSPAAAAAIATTTPDAAVEPSAKPSRRGEPPPEIEIVTIGSAGGSPAPDDIEIVTMPGVALLAPLPTADAVTASSSASSLPLSDAPDGSQNENGPGAGVPPLLNLDGTPEPPPPATWTHVAGSSRNVSVVTRREYDLDDILKCMLDPARKLELRTHRKALRKLQRAFHGSELIDWLIANGYTASGARSEAVAVGTALLNRRLIRSIEAKDTSQYVFYDSTTAAYHIPDTALPKDFVPAVSELPPPLKTETSVESPVKSARARGASRVKKEIKKPDVVVKKPVKVPVFGCELDVLMKSEPEGTVYPRVFWTLITTVFAYGGEATDGIGRLSPEVGKLNALRQQFEDGNYVIPPMDPHTPMSCLKLWLREMHEPVWPNSVYYQSVKNCENFGALREIVDSMPAISKIIILELVAFCRRLGSEAVAERTRMHKSNLALVFAPCVFRCPSNNPAEIMMNSTAEHKCLLSLVEGWPDAELDSNGPTALAPAYVDPEQLPAEAANDS